MRFQIKRSQIVPMNSRKSGLRSRGEEQDFEKLHAAALESGELFEDNEFLPVDESIFYSKSPPCPITWLRPHEIVDSPKFISDDASRFDVQQGRLGDCWLLAAVANLTLNKSLLHRVVPPEQSFDDQYAGIFRFRFWQYGRWVEVVIDDRLPTHDGSLIFMNSEDNTEFWTALFEKAYAKLYGSYEALSGGTTSEAMVDFSGGVNEVYELSKVPDGFHKVMMKASRLGSLMGCSIQPDPDVHEAVMENGLVRGHAYSITKICEADIETPNMSGKIPMVRVRNPWGNETEWNGAFSDKSPLWQFIPEEEREEMGLTFDADGEFWMTYRDFSTNFEKLEICSLGPDSFDEIDSSTQNDESKAIQRWETSVFEGAWVRGVTAGGCRNYIDSFHHNPQYCLTLDEADDEDDDDNCTIIVSVMQKNRRAMRKMGKDNLSIGYAIYHMPDPGAAPTPLDKRYFCQNASVARSGSYINCREMTSRFKVPPGTYTIIPTTFQPNEEGDFIVRVFSEKANVMVENDVEVGPVEIDEAVKPEAEPEYQQAIREAFSKIAGDDLEIDYLELQQVLECALRNEFEFEGFSKDTVRSMVALMDVDNSGKLGLDEFMTLWKNLRVWKQAFKLHDKDDTGNLSSFELREALRASGYSTNNTLLNCLMHRYGDKGGQISFNDYIALSVRMEACIEIFRAQDKENSGEATFSLSDWMEHFMYS